MLVHIRPVFKELAPSFVPGPGCGLYARFYQAKPAPVVGTTKCPESLCLMSALPPSGRRVPPPPRTFLLVHRSYGLMRQSHVALLYFGFWPRSWSLRRLLPAPAATGILPTLSLRIIPQMPEPMPRRFAECVCLVLPQHSSAFPIIRLGRLPASFREHDFPRVGFRGCSYFVMFRPPSLLASQIVPTAASSPAGQPRLFTSEQNVRRYLRTHRTCCPPDYRQLAERELSSQDSQPCRLLPNDADVSIAPPKIPYGGFSPVRFQGRYVRRGLPCLSEVFASAGLRPSFVSTACRVSAPFCVGGRHALGHFRASDFCCSTPGALTPVRVILSRSIHA